MSDGRGKAWFVAAVMGVVTLSMAAPTSVADDLVLNVPVASQNVQPGDLLAVTLDVTALFEPINAVQALIQYDAAVLTLQSIVPTNLLLPPPDAGWVEVFFTDNSATPASASSAVFSRSVTSQWLREARPRFSAPAGLMTSRPSA